MEIRSVMFFQEGEGHQKTLKEENWELEPIGHLS